MLNCDTITQVKEKILDAFFKGFPYSKRPQADDLDLVYVSSVCGGTAAAASSKQLASSASSHASADWTLKMPHGRLVLQDEDKTCKRDADDFKRLNTLAHYRIGAGAMLLLAPRQAYRQLAHSASTANNEPCNSYTLLDIAHIKNPGRSTGFKRKN